MLRILKHFYPFREIARIIDLHFQRLADLSRSLDEIAENHTAILQALTFTVERQQEQRATLERLEHALTKQAALFENELVRQVYVESDDYEAVNPETGLLTFLYSHLPLARHWMLGLTLGDVSNRLLKSRIRGIRL